MRVIVTGSRNWVGQWGIDKIFQVLDATLNLGRQMNQGFELIHGACPTGADDIANEWGIANSDEIMLTTWPADWDLYGKAAGPVRNEQMMAAGGDLCVAFLRSNSSGTLDAIGKARRRGIWTVVIPYLGPGEMIELPPRSVGGLMMVTKGDGSSELRVA
jgi:SLOG family YspA-like protein